jgi:hypothetical protein
MTEVKKRQRNEKLKRKKAITDFIYNDVDITGVTDSQVHSFTLKDTYKLV